MNKTAFTDYEIVLNSIKEYGIFMLDAEGYIQSWNVGAERIKGYSADEIIGKHFSIFYTQEDIADEKPQRELVIAKETGRYEEEGWRVKKDGSLFWGNIVITPIFDDKNILIGFSKVTRDLTDRRKADEQIRLRTIELTTANQQLEEANKHLEEFASIVSHDLKEPLRKITTFTGMVMAKDQEALSETSVMLMRKISESASRMNTMIDDILALSILSHQQPLQRESLEAIVQEVLVLLEQTIKEKHAVITTDNLPDALVIRSQFVQLFLNLLSNSLKFAKDDEPPVITITHQFVENNTLALPARYLQIQVKDNGIGFEPTEAESIFKLFTRLHGRAKYQGTGLGLGICRRVMENHHGTITAVSEVGEGATFIMHLPYP
jgi:PAS domain S-box-containing protein